MTFLKNADSLETFLDLSSTSFLRTSMLPLSTHHDSWQCHTAAMKTTLRLHILTLSLRKAINSMKIRDQLKQYE